MDYKKNYYEILGLSEDAKADDIKQAYKKMAKLYHPDLNPDNPEATQKFQEINEANEILSNPNKKLEYDRIKNGNEGFYFEDVDDDMIFGFQRAYNERFKNHVNLDIIYHVNLTLSDVYIGGIKEFEYTKKIKCPTCNGTKLNGVKTCETCLGHGLVDRTTKFSIDLTNVQPGVVNRISYQGGGHEYYINNLVGNLIVIFAVKDLMNYELDNNYNLYKFIEIHPDDCINGVEYEHKHLDGKTYKMTIPKGSNNGSLLKMKGLGLKNRYNDIRSDLYLKIMLHIDYSRYNKNENENNSTNS